MPEGPQITIFKQRESELAGSFSVSDYINTTFLDRVCVCVSYSCGSDWGVVSLFPGQELEGLTSD